MLINVRAFQRLNPLNRLDIRFSVPLTAPIVLELHDEAQETINPMVFHIPNLPNSSTARAKLSSLPLDNTALLN